LGLAIHAGKEVAAHEFRGRSRVWVLVGGMISVPLRLDLFPIGQNRVAERILGGGVPTARSAIEPFEPGDLHIVTQAQVQGQPGVEFPIILDVDPEIRTALIEGVIPVNAAAGGRAKQEARYRAPIRSTLAGVGELLCPTRVEVESSSSEPGVLG